MKRLTVMVFVVLMGGITLSAQNVPLHLLQSGDIAVPGYDGITGVATFSPNMSTGWHTHPGAMVGYVVEGAVVVERDGKEPVTVTAGESFIIPADTQHAETNKAKKTARVFLSYTIESGQRLRTDVAHQ